VATSSQTSSGVTPLHQAPQARPETVPPVQALYQPRPSDAWVPPLDSALSLAREDLKIQQGANIHDREAMIRAAVTLEIRLRLLLAALDADGIGRVAAGASAVSA
jgi:hypothetical protein